uniref:GIY-YIG domain-containing protein n=1 Tax=Acidicaldus sp. TaxID=1872105 RepID=A0A8J4HAK2_9PROT
MNSHSRFSEAVSQKLSYYVYRLIDPRNGETFYVGKGLGNRVFAHVKGDKVELGSDADPLTDKLQRIRDIRRDGFDVIHVIHRHGMDSDTAFEVEAALIDAYPEASNLVGGHASDERGLMHAKQIIERYEAKEIVFHHSALLINIRSSAAERDSIYEAVRYAWKLDPNKARQAELVLAVDQGLVVGVFIAEKWLAATMDNFPGTAVDRPGRWGFVGNEAPESLARLYMRRRVPDHMRKRGAANPIRYADTQSALGKLPSEAQA